MSEWKECKLGEVCVRLSSGKSISMKDTSSAGNFPIFGGNGIRGYSHKSNFEGECAIIGRQGAFCGNVRYFKGKAYMTEHAVILITNAENNTRFLSYFLSLQNLGNLSAQSAQPGISVKTLSEQKYLLPPIIEQKRIAGILSSLDDKIDLLNRQNQTLESMAEALFRHYFIDNAQPEWEEKTLGDFILVKHGFAFKGEYISSETTNQILITPGNFKIGGGFKSDKLKYYSDNNYSEEYLLNTDDLIVTMTDLSVNGDTLGYGALVPVISLNEKYLHNQRIGKVVFKQQIGKYFIYYLMKTEDYQWFILSGASGTSIRHTSPSSICSYSFKLPEQIKINEFERLASSIQEKIKYNQTQINTLSNLRNTLLPKLMNREVEITEEMK